MDEALWTRYDNKGDSKLANQSSQLDQDILAIQKKAVHDKRRKEEALLLEENDMMKNGELKTPLLKKSESKTGLKSSQNKQNRTQLVALSWKIQFQNYMLDSLNDSKIENSVELGIKMFHLISEFKL
jgi:hypothetical protein